MRVLSIVVLMVCAGCATPPAWETAELDCVDYANAACRAALEQNVPSGIVVCTPRGETVRHAVTWIGLTRNKIYWDATTGHYLRWEELGKIHWQTVGPSRGAWDICPLPGENQ